MQKRFQQEIKPEKAIVELTVEKATISKSQTAVYSIYDAKMRYTGRVSGKTYIWQKIGDAVLVDTEDVPFLLEKRLGSRSCCGGVNQDGNRVFEIRS